MNLLADKINLEQVLEYSKELAKNIGTQFNPDAIIGIKNGGLIPSLEISKILRKPLYTISAGRNVPPYNSKFPLLNKFYYELAFLRSSPKLLTKLDSSFDAKKILLVDDAIHTGKTVNLIMDYLKQMNNDCEVKTASINYIKKSIPDFYIKKGRINFPWSKNSKYYKDYEKYLEKSIKNEF